MSEEESYFTMDDLQRFVTDAARRLDTERPGWWHEIDTKRLDLASRSDCILGQIYGSYGKGCMKIGILLESQIQTCAPFTTNYARDFWLHEIALREAVEVPPPHVPQMPEPINVPEPEPEPAHV